MIVTSQRIIAVQRKLNEKEKLQRTLFFISDDTEKQSVMLNKQQIVIGNAKVAQKF